jgi:hypothetical protein
MQAFLLAVIVAGGAAFGAAWFLNNEFQQTAASAFTSNATVRVSDPGENLVGERWDGLAGVEG